MWVGGSILQCTKQIPFESPGGCVTVLQSDSTHVRSEVVSVAILRPPSPSPKLDERLLVLAKAYHAHGYSWYGAVPTYLIHERGESNRVQTAW